MNLFDFIFKNNHFFRFVFGWKRNGRLYHLNLEEYIEEIERHIAILKKLGVSKGDRIGFISNTRAEWHFLDMASLALGAIGVPIYPSFTKNELREIQKYCNISIFILENSTVAEGIEKDILANRKILIIEEGKKIKLQNVFQYDDLLDNIKEEYGALPSLKELSQNIQEEDICNYLLTSGTTSAPKVSVITHKSLYYLLDNIRHLMRDQLAPGSKSLVHLPLSHVLGRCDSLLHLVLPVENIIGESINSMISDLQLVKPTYFITVPRIIRKIRERVIDNIENKGGLSEKAFNYALSISSHFLDKTQRGNSPSNLERQTFYFVQNNIMKEIREQISPNLKFIVSGGAPLKEDDYRFFQCLGIPIIQGYGLTETLGPVTFNSLGKIEKGSVGQPFKDIHIIIAEDGEILIKGPSIFTGYLQEDGNINRSDFTEEGFFKTGDIGELLASGNLKITDRKKDLIVTSYGKNISPLKVEAAMTKSPFIDFFMTIGEGRNYISGLVGINKDSFSELINQNPKYSTEDLEGFSQKPEVIEIINTEIKRINEELSDFEKVKKFKILPIDLRYEEDFITPSLKIKRNQVYNKFLPLINAMYN